MRVSGRWLRRQISGCLLLALVAPFMAAAAFAQQGTNSNQNAEGSSSVQVPSQEPDLSGKKLNARSPQTGTLPDSPGFVHSQTIAENRPGGGQQQASPQQQQSGAQEPVGTAASGPVKATGVAASQPAGAAIAPAKQRRTRSILIKVSALVGAGVAVGTVVALTSASPSRPR